MVLMSSFLSGRWLLRPVPAAKTMTPGVSGWALAQSAERVRRNSPPPGDHAVICRSIVHKVRNNADMNRNLMKYSD
jgi:hypothetical protein